MATAKDVIKYIKENDIQFVDLRFVDLPGMWQHVTLPAHRITEDLFEEGQGFDGSSIRGFQAIQNSDMLLMPDPDTIFEDSFAKYKQLNIICNIQDPTTGERYHKDPRAVAQNAENYLTSTGLGDASYFGPEPEFFIFDSIRYDQNKHMGFYEIDSSEGQWNTGAEEDGGNLGHKPRHKGAYFPVPPVDSLHDLRAEMVLNLEAAGIKTELHHHEVASGGQSEIAMEFDKLTRMADKLLTSKYVVKNTAFKNGKTVTYMPKPLFEDNGSGMHCHQSIWKNGQPTFYAEGTYAGLSDQARWYVGGLLKHASALCAFINPTTNSYRRLVPGYEAPIYLAYSQRNRSAAIRIPLYSSSPKAKRIEFRTPDPTANPYLAFSAMLMAGIDGIQNKIEPPAPIDKNIYDLSPEEYSKIQAVPASLAESLNALEADMDFLLKGDVFNKDLIESWLSLKRAEELDQIRLRPHPYEFALYFDV
jgi:glutamine synthetase